MNSFHLLSPVNPTKVKNPFTPFATRSSFPSFQSSFLLSPFRPPTLNFKLQNTRHVSLKVRCKDDDTANNIKVLQKSEGKAPPVIRWKNFGLLIFRLYNQISKPIKSYYEVKKDAIWDFLLDISKHAPSPFSEVFSAFQSIGLHHFRSRRTKPRNIAAGDLVDVPDLSVESKEILSILLKKGQYAVLEAKLPNGILLYGPVGTGKATFAHALAQDSQIPFYVVLARELPKDGTSSVEIRKKLSEARAYSPSIVFIKDIDAIAGQREDPESSPHLSQLIAELEKCKYDGKEVLVIASTTKTPETLQSALYGYGWFFKKLYVGKPDKDARKSFARKSFAALNLEEFLMEEDKEAICNHIASETLDAGWADLTNVVDESVRLVSRRGGKHVTMDDVVEALKGIKRNILEENDESISQQLQHMVGSMS